MRLVGVHDGCRGVGISKEQRWRGLRWLENGSCSTAYSVVDLGVVACVAEAIALSVEIFLRKRLAGSENCCTFASANGEERLTLVIFQLFQLLVCRFF